MFDTNRRRLLEALGIGGALSVAGCSAPSDTDAGAERATQTTTTTRAAVDVDRVAADPTDVPDPIDRSGPKEHDITLEVEEVTAEIEDGVTFEFMTFGGQVPG
ncbi:MAG: nitrite reductase, copper-containing, partial [Haloplanus sp.]